MHVLIKLLMNFLERKREVHLLMSFAMDASRKLNCMDLLVMLWVLLKVSF